MKTEKPDLPRHVTEYLDSEGFSQLYPPQADCVRSGLLDGASLLVSAPTASGKTLIAALAMISYLSKNRGKIVYLSPLRALAAEKFAEFKRLEKAALGRGVRVSISTGDFENLEKDLEKSDVLVMTNEKMDSVIRHGAEWVDDIGLVIADEVHLIGDEARGPALEMTLTQLKLLEARPQIIGLSATVTNSGDIADWLGCRLVENDWRPVPLSEGVSDAGSVAMNDGTAFEFECSPRGTAVDLGVQSVRDGGQSLVFAETRLRSRSLAAKAADAVSGCLKKSEAAALRRASKKILADNEHTDLVKALAAMVEKGVAFHHAGLSQNCRQAVEAEFRKGTVKLLSSTPTLAAGVNLPARRVVISSISRYDARLGANKPISVLEYKQLCGRAGRPQFDDYGEAIIVGNGNTGELFERYVNGEPEPIESKVTGDQSLRVHVLSVIVTHPGIKKDEVLEFFLQTLGGRQSRRPNVKFSVDISLRFLSGQSMIVRKGERYAATELGKKTSMLYLDPLTATRFMDAVKNASAGRGHALGFLHLISDCGEFFPRFALRNRDYEAASLMIENNSSELLGPVSEYDCSRSLLALQSWITESSETSLSEGLGIEPGDMHRMVEAGDRLAYCLREIAGLAGRADLLDELDSLRRRIAYGIRADLLDLVRVRGIGRVRARALYGHGIRSLDDLAGTPVKKLAGIDKIGPAIAANIKSELRRVRR